MIFFNLKKVPKFNNLFILLSVEQHIHLIQNYSNVMCNNCIFLWSTMIP